MPPPRSLNPRYIATLALISGAILLIGWFIRPAPTSDQPGPIPSEGELARLARLTQRRALEDTTDYFSDVADEVERSLVHVPTVNATGIAWDAGFIVTGRFEARVPETLMVATATNADRGRVAAWGPRLPLAAVQTPEGMPEVVAVRRLETSVSPGDWIVAVWRTDRGRLFAPANFLQTTTTSCGEVVVEEVMSTLALARTMAGGGLFDVDGNLLAVILPCDGRLSAVTADSVDAVLVRATTLERRLIAQYGLDVSVPTDEEKHYFETSAGVIVRALWMGYVADEAGLVPGDVIVALNGRPVGVPGDLEELVGPVGGELSEVVVRRDGRDLPIVLSRLRPTGPDEAAIDAGAGLVWEAVQTGYRIESVRPGSAAAVAGIDPGDRLLRIDGEEPVSLEAVEQLFAGDQALPVFVEIEREGRRLGFLLQ